MRLLEKFAEDPNWQWIVVVVVPVSLTIIAALLFELSA